MMERDYEEERERYRQDEESRRHNLDEACTTLDEISGVSVPMSDQSDGTSE